MASKSLYAGESWPWLAANEVMHLAEQVERGDRQKNLTQVAKQIDALSRAVQDLRTVLKNAF